MEKVEKFTVKHKETGEELYPGLTGGYIWALRAAINANKQFNNEVWIVYKIQDGEKR